MKTLPYLLVVIPLAVWLVAMNVYWPSMPSWLETISYMVAAGWIVGARPKQWSVKIPWWQFSAGGAALIAVAVIGGYLGYTILPWLVGAALWGFLIRFDIR